MVHPSQSLPVPDLPGEGGAHKQIDLGVPKTGVARRSPYLRGRTGPAVEKLDVPFVEDED